MTTKSGKDFDQDESTEKYENENVENSACENVENDSENERKKVPLGERIEDALDNFFGGIKDFFYGPRTGTEDDIPATYEMDSGRIKILKYKTRRNILLRLMHGKGFKITFGMIASLILGIVILIIYVNFFK